MDQLKFSSFSKLHTKRLSLRFPNMSDAQPIFNLRTNTIINKYITRPAPQNLEDAEQFITMISKNIKINKNLYWLIMLDQTQDIIGSIGYHSFSDDFSFVTPEHEKAFGFSRPHIQL